MKIEESIYDVFEILKALSDDSDVMEEFVLSRLNSYRSQIIARRIENEGILSAVWLQDMPLYSAEKVNSADDPAIAETSVTVGKITIPNVISTLGGEGIFRVSTPSRHFPYSPVDYGLLFMKIRLDEIEHQQYGFYYTIGNNLYTYPYASKIKATLILDNPLDGQVLENSVWRNRVLSDDWHTDRTTANEAILSVLTKDYQISKREIADFVNDAQAMLNVLQAANMNEG